jgi:hypothetical protein
MCCASATGPAAEARRSRDLRVVQSQAGDALRDLNRPWHRAHKDRTPDERPEGRGHLSFADGVRCNEQIKQWSEAF